MKFVLSPESIKNGRFNFKEGTEIVLPFNVGLNKHDIYIFIERNKDIEITEDLVEMASLMLRPGSTLKSIGYKAYYRTNDCKIELFSGSSMSYDPLGDPISKVLKEDICPKIPVNFLIVLASTGTMDPVNVDNDIRISFIKLDDKAVIPEYKTSGSSGFDLTAIEGGTIQPGSVVLFKTGLAVEIPRGYELQVRPRSGLSINDSVTVINTPGTVDSDYRGEIMVGLINHGKEPFTVKKGTRIAQGVIAPVMKALFREEENLSETDRGSNGFGSTGV